MAVKAARDAIVVGIDGSLDSDRAVTWAVELALLTHQPVHYVHVAPEAPRTLTDIDVQARWAENARVVLDEAVTRAERVPGLRVSSETIDGSGLATAEALVAASRNAAMLVVGSRGHGGYAGMLLGSVSQHAARHADCPVITVRGTAAEVQHRVVVGVDRSDGAEDALALACQLAAALDAPVTAIHAWRAPALHGAGVALPMPEDTGQAIEREEQLLAEQLDPWRHKHPALHISAEAVPGHAAAVLTDASEHAALVVVGSRGRGAFAGMLLGSVSQSVLHHAHCPVAVAR